MGNEYRRAVVTADEEDVHTRWRRYYTGLRRPGATAAVKTATNRRERHVDEPAELAAELDDDLGLPERGPRHRRGTACKGAPAYDRRHAMLVTERDCFDFMPGWRIVTRKCLFCGKTTVRGS